MHSPHPYLAAVGSYRRWFSVLILVLFFGWIASFAILEGPFRAESMGIAYGAIPLLNPRFILYGWLLGLLAVILGAHLKEMLGRATAQLAPGLVRAHFLVAGVIVALFAIVVPLATYWGLGFRGAATAVMAMTLAAMSVSALVTFRWSWTVFFVLYSPALTVFVDRHLGRQAMWTPSAGAIIVLLIVAVACLMTFSLRVARLNEEMPEYSRGIPTSWRAIETWKGSTTGVGGWSFPLPMPRNLRALGNRRDVTSESLLQRALHLHGASRSLWGAVAGGTVVVFMYGVYWLFFGWSGTNQWLSNPMNLMLSVLPMMMFVHPRNRAQLQHELMRPYSRKQYIQAIGTTLATSCVLCWLFVNIAPVLVLWFAMSENPLDVSTVQGPVHVTLRQQLPLSLCMTPVLFGAVAWPHKHFAFLVGTIAGISALSTVPLFVNDQLVKLSALNFRILLAGLFATGLLLTWRSYRRWLNFEFEG